MVILHLELELELCELQTDAFLFSNKKDCFQFMNNFENRCLLTIFHIYATLLGNCVKYLVVLACVKQLFTALPCMQRGIGDRTAFVRLSVCLSVKCVHCDKTKAPSEKKFNYD